MSRYVEAPAEWGESDVALDGPAVFLAGGITGCPDWQAEARGLLEGLTVLNPRRADFPIHDPSAALGQIEWEFRHLERADVVLFWFPASESPQPIALYELGRHAALGRAIVVGCDPAYPRRADVEIQLGLARPEVAVHAALESVCGEARAVLAG